MLVLTRKSGEEIQIGDDIVVRVVEVRGSRVRVGITAPDAVSIRRGELNPFPAQADSPQFAAVAAEAP